MTPPSAKSSIGYGLDELVGAYHTTLAARIRVICSCANDRQNGSRREDFFCEPFSYCFAHEQVKAKTNRPFARKTMQHSGGNYGTERHR
jgi:hypothetical protein